MDRLVTSIWKGDIFLKDYDVKECIRLKQDMHVTFGDQTMTIGLKNLTEKGRLQTREYTSQHKGKHQVYKLVAFKWIPNLVNND